MNVLVTGGAGYIGSVVSEGATRAVYMEAVLILTEWELYGGLGYRGNTVIDGRGIDAARKAAIYEGICW